jgi:hypothetical protein
LEVKNDFEKFGTKILLKVKEEENCKEEYLIHFPSFIKIAKENGFEIINLSNFSTVFEDYKEIYFDQLKAFNVFTKEKKTLNQLDMIELFSIFILKKL